jgi:methylase of polypeptide subunit release factors
MLDAAGVLAFCDGGLRSTIRVSRLHGRLFIHSAYPTEAEDAVFFGPDSYRFADFVARRLGGEQDGRIVDLGGGCGVGAIVAAGLSSAAEVIVADVNANALRFARINAAHANLPVRTCKADGLDGIAPGMAVILANPPYMAGASQTYRDGGDMHGGELSLQWAEAALDKLAPGGRLLLYTGSAIATGGGDPLRAALASLVEARRARLDYREIDPDVFGEELETPAYADVERIAVIACEITR